MVEVITDYSPTFKRYYVFFYLLVNFVNTMKIHKGLFFFLTPMFSVLFSITVIFAQQPALENSFYQQSLANAKAFYHQSFGNQGALYNGSEYKEYEVRFKEGHPYFQSPRPGNATIIYGGILYDSIPMRYDEISDQLVIHDQTDKIQLLKEKVTSFSLFNNDFIKIEKDSLSANLVSSGFYNLLYKGKICLFKKEIKAVKEEASTNVELLSSVEERDYYYIKMDGKFYEMKNKHNLFVLMHDKKKEVQQFIKSNELSFRSNKQEVLTKATAYYDSLKK